MTTRRYVWPVDMRLCIPSSNGAGGFVVAIDTGQSRGTVGTVVVITDVSPAWKNRNDIMMSSLVIQSMHSKRRVVMMPTLSSLVAPQTCGATSGDKVDITTTFGLQSKRSRVFNIKNIPCVGITTITITHSWDCLIREHLHCVSPYQGIWARLNIKTVFPGMGNSIEKTVARDPTQYKDSLTSIWISILMGIPILVIRRFYFETPPHPHPHQ